MKTIIVSIPSDAAKKAEKFFSKNIDWCKQPCFCSLMPDQPDPNNRMLSVRISRELFRKLQKAAEESDSKFNEFVRWVIVSKVDHIALDESDYAQIIKEKKEFLKRKKG